MKKQFIRTFTCIPLKIWGILTISWGIICFLGGPDPGAGSGNEGFKWGLGYVSLGTVIFYIGKYCYDKSKELGNGS